MVIVYLAIGQSNLSSLACNTVLYNTIYLFGMKTYIISKFDELVSPVVIIHCKDSAPDGRAEGRTDAGQRQHYIPPPWAGNTNILTLRSPPNGNVSSLVPQNNMVLLYFRIE